MKVHFDKRSIERLPLKPKRYNVFDSATRGLGLAIYSTGAKTFFHLRKVQGWPERTTIGPFPDLSVEQARGKAAELNGKLSRWKADDYQGPHPLERRSRTMTFAELVQEYVARHVMAKAKNPTRALYDINWTMGRYLPSWKTRAIGTIRRKDVADLLRDVGAAHGQVSANRTVQFIRRLYNFASKSDIFTGDNPARGVELYSERSRTRFLSGEELARLFAALRKEKNATIRDFVLLALFTGARRGDILSMRWNDLDLERATWAIPNPKSTVSYVVPLVSEAVEILKRRPKTSEFLFPRTTMGALVSSIRRAWDLLASRAKIQDLHIHDLRRTLGSWQAGLGASLSVIGKSLGHSSFRSTAVYARLDLNPVRASVAAATQAMIAAGNVKPKMLKAANRG